MQNIPAAFSGNIPEHYDAGLGPMFFEPFAQHIAARIGKLAPTHILELASGTGRLTRLLPSVATANASIIASDINPAMVGFGQKQTSGETIQWMEIDAVSLPFDDNLFDCVVVQFGVMFYSDRIRAFREALRVLKPGGHFIFSCWDSLEHNPLPTIVNGVLEQFFPVDTPAFYSIPFAYHNEHTIHNDLATAGFDRIQIDKIALTGFSKTAEAATIGAIKGTPTITAIEERNAALLPDLMKATQHKIAEQFGESNLQIPLQAFVVTCIKN